MNFLKRVSLYTVRKAGKSIVLFFLLFLLTTFITVGFSVLDATQKAAAALRETVGASFSIQGKIDTLSFEENGTGYTASTAFLTEQDISMIMREQRIKVYNAVQTSTARPNDLFTLSGREDCPISANTETVWNSYFSMGILELTDGTAITANHSMSAIISGAFAEENNLTVGSKLFLSSYSPKGNETTVCLEIVALYASDHSMEFDDDTVFLTHDAYWKLTNSTPQTYSGKVSFIVTDPVELDNVIEQIKQLDGIDWENYIFSKSNESYEAISYQLSTLERLTTILISVSAVICAAILFLILAMRIRNRVHEAGIMLAIGISKGNIIIQYMTEVGVLLVLAFMVSWFASTSITAGIAAYLQKLIGNVDIMITSYSLILQYFCETAVTGIAVIIASIPIIHLHPKDILSKID